MVDPMHESLAPMLEPLGWQVDYHPAITRNELRDMHMGYHGLIIRSKTIVDRALLGEQPTLRFVGRAGAGLDNLDLARRSLLAAAIEFVDDHLDLL